MIKIYQCHVTSVKGHMIRSVYFLLAPLEEGVFLRLQKEVLYFVHIFFRGSTTDIFWELYSCIYFLHIRGLHFLTVTIVTDSIVDNIPISTSSAYSSRMKAVPSQQVGWPQKEGHLFTKPVSHVSKMAACLYLSVCLCDCSSVDWVISVVSEKLLVYSASCSVNTTTLHLFWANLDHMWAILTDSGGPGSLQLIWTMEPVNHVEPGCQLAAWLWWVQTSIVFLPQSGIQNFPKPSHESL